MNKTELCQFLSRVIPSVKTSAINTIGLNLYKAGMASGGGRGPVVPDVTAQDAANILIGVMTSTQPAKAVEFVQICRQLAGDTGFCCGLPGGTKDPWIFGEVMERLMTDDEKAYLVEKIVICKTEPYAEIHWLENEKSKCMIFGEKPQAMMRVDCTMDGVALHQLALEIKPKQRGQYNPVTGKMEYF